jgi:hypothetical protein
MVTILAKFTIGEECRIHLMIRDTYEIVVERTWKEETVLLTSAEYHKY